MSRRRELIIRQEHEVGDTFPPHPMRRRNEKGKKGKNKCYSECKYARNDLHEREKMLKLLNFIFFSTRLKRKHSRSFFCAIIDGSVEASRRVSLNQQ